MKQIPCGNDRKKGKGKGKRRDNRNCIGVSRSYGTYFGNNIVD
jgi:hypothetical protein